MDIELLIDIGLSPSLAKTYAKLVALNGGYAPDIAKAIGETRTNGYKLLERLYEIGLATKNTARTRIWYHPTSPAALEQFLNEQRAALDLRTRRLSASLPSMLSYYHERSERPSIRYFEGGAGLAQINQDQLTTGQPMKYVRTDADASFLGFAALHKLRNNFPARNIERDVLITDSMPYELPVDNRMPVQESDKLMLLHRTWLRPQDYTAPVEWVAYGDKLSIVVYGEDAMGMIIESSQIAKAFRELFELMKSGARSCSDYATRPLIATHTAIPTNRDI